MHGEPELLSEPTPAAPEELPTPAPQETLPAPSAGPYGSASGRPRGAGTPASGTELTRRFEWGPLGTGAEDASSQDDTWSRIVEKSKPAEPRPTQSVLKSAARADGGQGVATQVTDQTPPVRDSRVRRAEHRQTQPEPKRTPRYEPLPNQSAGAAFGAAASGQRP
jgi:hypothetical protein